jgi:1-acyl-sn-glycerol-3-phosphate acyltransferase
MLRTFWVAIVAVAVTILFGTAVLVVAMVSSSSPWIDRIIRLWARSLVRAAGIELRTENLDAIKPDERYILVANHYSYFDIPCIFAAVSQQPIRFMAKQSLFKIPIFGWSIGRAGFIPIDRKNKSKAKQSFDLAVQRIRKGNTIVIFPEEGRSRERTMRPFQSGAFLLALKSDRPIVPIAIDGTYDVYNAKSRLIRAGRVTVKAGTVLPTEGLKVRDKERLLTESRAQIQTMLFGSAEDPAPAASEPPA